ncbi:MAG: hypothetical protein Q4G34_01725 [Micrococcus sp.]|nr:hypothetical protein [Micrococcus sp.]
MNESVTRRLLGPLIGPEDIVYSVAPMPQGQVLATLRGLLGVTSIHDQLSDGRQWVLVDQQESAFIVSLLSTRVVERLDVRHWAKRRHQLLDTVDAGDRRFRILHRI